MPQIGQGAYKELNGINLKDSDLQTNHEIMKYNPKVANKWRKDQAISEKRSELPPSTVSTEPVTKSADIR